MPTHPSVFFFFLITSFLFLLFGFFLKFNKFLYMYVFMYVYWSIVFIFSPFSVDIYYLSLYSHSSPKIIQILSFIGLSDALHWFLTEINTCPKTAWKKRGVYFHTTKRSQGKNSKNLEARTKAEIMKESYLLVVPYGLFSLIFIQYRTSGSQASCEQSTPHINH